MGGASERRHPSITNFGNVRIATGDLTGDGLDDVAVAIADAGSLAVVRGRPDGALTAPAAADVYALRAPDGSFIPRPAVSLALGDIDENGSLDVVLGYVSTMLGASTIEVVKNDGHGALSSAASLPSGNPEHVSLAALGGDGDLDRRPTTPAQGPQSVRPAATSTRTARPTSSSAT
jgi:hypothetical protein